MKTLFIFLIVYAFIINVSASDGTDCQNAIEAKPGTNTSDFSVQKTLWYKYTATQDGNIDLKFPSTFEISLKAYDEFCSQISVYNKYPSSNFKIYAKKGKEYRFNVRINYPDTNLCKWTLAESVLKFGWSFESALETDEGEWQMPDNTIFTKYLAKSNGKLSVLAQGYYIRILDSVKNIISDQIHSISINCKKGAHYVIYISEWGYINQRKYIINEREFFKGETADNPLEAKDGLNICNHQAVNYNDLFFKYKFKKDEIVEISSCGLTSEQTNLQIFEMPYIENNAYLFVSNNCGRGQSKLLYKGHENEEIIIKWLGQSTSGNYYWELKPTEETSRGSSCLYTKHSAIGLNTSVLTYNSSISWHYYDTEKNNLTKIVVKSKNKDGFNYNYSVVKSCDLSDSVQLFRLNDSFYFKSQPNTKYYILFSSENLMKSDTFELNWELSEVADSIVEINNCQNPLPATLGLNTTNNKLYSQYYSYTSDKDCLLKITLKTVDLSLNNFLDIYRNTCNETTNNFIKEFDNCIIPVSAGEKIIIGWENWWYKTTFDWELSILKSSADITSITSYYQTKPALIDNENATATLEVSKNTDLSQLIVNYKTSPFATSSYYSKLITNPPSEKYYILKNDFSSDTSIVIRSFDKAIQRYWKIKVVNAGALLDKADFIRVKCTNSDGSFVDAIIKDDSVLINKLVTCYSIDFQISPMAKLYDEKGERILQSIQSGMLLEGIFKWKIIAENGTEKEWHIKVRKVYPEVNFDAVLGTNEIYGRYTTSTYRYVANTTGLLKIKLKKDSYHLSVHYRNYNFETEKMWDKSSDTFEVPIIKDSVYYIDILSYGSFELSEEPIGKEKDIVSCIIFDSTSQVNIIKEHNLVEIKTDFITDTIINALIKVSPGAIIQGEYQTFRGYSLPVYFLEPLNVKVIAQDSSYKMWSVIWLREPAEMHNDILWYSPSQETSEVLINKEKREINVKFNSGTDFKKMAPFFILSPNAKAYIGSVEQISGITKNDFSANLSYSIVSQSNDTAHWIVKNATLNNININDAVFSVYPNPAINFITVTLNNSNESYKVQLLDIQGKIALSSNSLSGTNTINVASLNSGLYILKVETSKFIWCKKIIKN